MTSVYRITNSVTGKCYIGICESKVRRRWRRHVNSADANKPRNRNCPALHGAIRKYGEAAFSIETLYEAVNWKEACMVERGLIAQYGTMAPNGYNLTSGGEGRLGVKPSAAHRAATSERNKGRILSPETRARMSASSKGRKLDPDHVEKIRVRMKTAWADPTYKAAKIAELTQARIGSPCLIEANRRRWLGKKHKPETCAKMSAWQVGKKHSQETKDKIAAKATGRKKTPEQIEEMRARPFSPEHRAKIKAALKDRYFSPEHRAAISEGLKRRWARRAEQRSGV